MGPVKTALPFQELPSLEAQTVLAARARRGGLVAIFDFDGTLVNIARHPDAVHTTPRMGSELTTLARRNDTTVGVVSGRPLDHLLHLIDAPGIWLFGLHGWEHRAPGGAPVREWPPSALGVARRQRALLRERLGHSEGELIEDKGPIVAVHTRNANPDRRARVERVVHETRVPELELVVGRRVLELRPLGGPTKGHGVRTIAATRPDAPILYVGDDTTDEDAFAVLGPDDFPVLVDDMHAHHERPRGAVAHARWAIADTSEVHRLIQKLSDVASCPT